MTKQTILLSSLCGKNEDLTMIEEDQLLGVNADELLIDEGFYLEVYCNFDGKYDEESSEGASTFIYFDRSITLEKLLEIFEGEGNIFDDTLTINVIPNENPMFQDERNFSATITKKLEELEDSKTPPKNKEYIFRNESTNNSISHKPSNRLSEKFYLQLFEDKYKNDGYELIINND